MTILRSPVGFRRELLSSGYYVIGNLAAPLAAFALLPFLTRHLTLEDIGGIFIFQAMLLVSVNITAAGSMSVLQGLYFQVKDQFPLYLVSSMATSVILWLIISVLGFWQIEFLSSSFGLPTIVCAVAIFSSIGAVFLAVALATLQVKQQPKKYFAVLVCVHSFSFLTSVFLIFFVSPSLQSRVIGIVLGTSMGAFFALYYFRDAIVCFPKFEVMRKLFGVGLPVILHSSAMLLIAQTDKFLIVNFLSLSEVGSYGVSAQLASVIQILAGGMAMAFTPNLYKKLASPNQDDGGKSTKIFKFFILILYVFLVCYLLFIYHFNALLFGSNFTFNEVTFLILAVGSALFGTYPFFSGYFYYYQSTKILALITCTVALINLVASYKLIPKYGINGAAVGTLIAYTVALLSVLCASIFLKKSTLRPEK